jgi:hypothetical protein
MILTSLFADYFWGLKCVDLLDREVHGLVCIYVVDLGISINALIILEMMNCSVAALFINPSRVICTNLNIRIGCQWEMFNVLNAFQIKIPIEHEINRRSSIIYVCKGNRHLVQAGRKKKLMSTAHDSTPKGNKKRYINI